jgi:hypothetical protein
VSALFRPLARAVNQARADATWVERIASEIEAQEVLPEIHGWSPRSLGASVAADFRETFDRRHERMGPVGLRSLGCDVLEQVREIPSRPGRRCICAGQRYGPTSEIEARTKLHSSSRI